jgi:hypothetical protein
MRPRMYTKVDIEEAMQQIEVDVRKYSKAIKTIMELQSLNYKEAKRQFELRLTTRLVFKN